MPLEVSLEVSKAHARLNAILYDCGSGCSSWLLLQHDAFQCTTSLPTMMTMERISETVSKSPMKCFFYELPWSWCLFTETE